jgi:hypothetical protein
MNFWKIAWEWHWATLEQMKLAVEKGFITAEQFEEITGETYEEGD